MKVEGNQIQIHFMAGRTITSTIKFNGYLLRFRMSHSGKKKFNLFFQAAVEKTEMKTNSVLKIKESSLIAEDLSFDQKFLIFLPESR